MTLYTNGEAVWTFAQMRDVVFPAEIEGVGHGPVHRRRVELRGLARRVANTGIYKKVDEESLAVADPSREASKRLRAELAKELGYYPPSLAAEDVARYREQIAGRKARAESGERDGWAPGGYKWRQWDHLKEERRRTEIETQGRASVADLYE